MSSALATISLDKAPDVLRNSLQSKSLFIVKKRSEPRLKGFAQHANNSNSQNSLRKSFGHLRKGEADNIMNTSNSNSVQLSHSPLINDEDTPTPTAAHVQSSSVNNLMLISSSHARFESLGTPNVPTSNKSYHLTSQSSAAVKSQLLFSKPFFSSHALLNEDSKLVSNLSSHQQRVPANEQNHPKIKIIEKNGAGYYQTRSESLMAGGGSSISTRFSIQRQKQKKTHTQQHQQIIKQSLVSRLSLSPARKDQTQINPQQQQQQQVQQNQVVSQKKLTNHQEDSINSSNAPNTNLKRHKSPLKEAETMSLDQPQCQILFENPLDEQKFNKTISFFNTNFLGKQLTLNNKTSLQGILNKQKANGASSTQFDQKNYDRFTQYMRDNKLNNLIMKNENPQSSQLGFSTSSPQLFQQTSQNFFASEQNSPSIQVGDYPPQLFFATPSIPYMDVNFPSQSKWKYNMNVESKAIAAYSSASNRPLVSKKGKRVLTSMSSTRQQQFNVSFSNIPAGDPSGFLRNDVSPRSPFSPGMGQLMGSPLNLSAQQHQLITSMKHSKFKKIFEIEDDEQPRDSDTYQIKSTMVNKQSPPQTPSQSAVHQSSSASQLFRPSNKLLEPLQIPSHNNQGKTMMSLKVSPTELTDTKKNIERNRYSFEEQFSELLSKQVGIDLKKCMPQRAKKQVQVKQRKKVYSFSSTHIPEPSVYMKQQQPNVVIVRNRIEINALMNQIEKQLLNSQRVKALSHRIVSETELTLQQFIQRYCTFVQTLFTTGQKATQEYQPKQAVFNNTTQNQKMKIRNEFSDVQISPALQDSLLKETMVVIAQAGGFSQEEFDRIQVDLRSRMAVVLKVNSILNELGGQLNVKRMLFQVRDEVKSSNGLTVFSSQEEVDSFLSIVCTENEESAVEFTNRFSARTFWIVKEAIDRVFSLQSARKRAVTRFVQQVEKARWMLTEGVHLKVLESFQERREIVQELMEHDGELVSCYLEEPTSAVVFLLVDSLCNLVLGRITASEFLENVLVRKFQREKIRSVVLPILESLVQRKLLAEYQKISRVVLYGFERNLYSIALLLEGENPVVNDAGQMRGTTLDKSRMWEEFKRETFDTAAIESNVESFVKYLFEFSSDVSSGLYSAADANAATDEAEITRDKVELVLVALRRFLRKKGMYQHSIDAIVERIQYFSLLFPQFLQQSQLM